MTINPANIATDLDAIGVMTQTPGVCDRPTFSPAWAAARAHVIAEAEKAGCRVWTDCFGNVHARPRALPDDAKVWLSGSHIDSVPTGGKFDGVMGVVAALEILRAANAAGEVAPLELVVFAEEEGTTFNLGMLGSRAWAGTLSADDLSKLRNAEGQSPLQAGAAFGVDSSQFQSQRLLRDHYRGLIEIHAEQGPAMWERDEPVAIVVAINGRRQYAVTLNGEANHAGSTPMGYRKDALAGAAECVVALERLALSSTPGLRYAQDTGVEGVVENVLTVGRLVVKPNGINVISGEVTFTIDFRSPSNSVLDAATTEIEKAIRAIADRRGLKVALTQTEALPAMRMDGGVVAALRSAAESAGTRVTETTSGALHDAAILAPIIPTAMIFVASRGGISHNPAELSRIEDIASATKLLAAVVMQGAR